MKTIFVSLFTVLLTVSNAMAWGERGHHLVGTTAALIVKDGATKDPAQDVGLRDFFSQRKLMFGHLSNIPDIMWKDKVAKGARVLKLNGTTHFLDPEVVLGIPDKDLTSFAAKLRAIPADYATLKKNFEGKQNPLAKPGSLILIYEGLGTAPWRAQQLYSLMVKAFACAKSKDGQTDAKDATDSIFELPDDKTGLTSDVPLPTYQCSAKHTRRGDLLSAVVIGGILSHFVGDMGQPYHASSNYDGWVTGNGGIHAYFETDVVNELGEKLNDAVLKKAQDSSFAGRVWNNLGTDVNAENGVAQLLLNLASDSYSHIEELNKIDDKVAIQQKSTILAWGASPDATAKAAVRKPASDRQVRDGFKDLIVSRIATSSVLLAKLWLSAWQAGGNPSLKNMPSYSPSYPVDPPFIWPDYDLDALARSKQ